MFTVEQRHLISIPVSLSGEHADHGGSLVDLKNVGERLKNIEVEERVTGDRTVESSLNQNNQIIFKKIFKDFLINSRV